MEVQILSQSNAPVTLLTLTTWFWKMVQDCMFHMKVRELWMSVQASIALSCINAISNDIRIKSPPKQQKCKNNMNTDAERYVDKHPKFEVKTEHYIAVV